MQYILLIYGDENGYEKMSESEMEAIYEGHRKYGEEMEKAGVIRGGAELQPTSTARTLRFGHGDPRLLDGPFAETKEQLGGYYVIDVETMEEAVEWARKMPGMSGGSVEIRPLGVVG